MTHAHESATSALIVEDETAQNRPNKVEFACVVILIAAVLVITSLPYVVGWATSRPDAVFEGFIIDLDDIHSHLAKMQQGYASAWEFVILFTPEPHAPAPINLFYLALGHVARLLRLNLVAVYHGARLLFGAVFLGTAYAFVASFLKEREERLLAFFFICFGSGLGWLALLLSGSFTSGALTPADFWFIEMYGFFTVMLFPHTCLALTLMLALLMLGARYIEGDRWWVAAAAAPCGLGLAVIHPYTLLIVDLVLFGCWAINAWQQRRPDLLRLAGLIAAAAVPLPLVVIQYLSIAQNPVLAAWQAQSSTFSPPPQYYILGYGIVFLLAIPGGWWALRQPARRWWLLPLWLVIVAPLLYAPVVFNLQRRMIEGAQAPLAILGAVGMYQYLLPAVRESRFAGWLAERGYRRERLALLTRNLVVALTLPSTLFLLISAGLAAAQSPALRLSQDEIAAVDWIGSHSDPGDTVLSSYRIGGFVPARIGHRAFLGHWAETINLKAKEEAVGRFFGSAGGESKADDTYRQDLLRQYGIQYVFVGPHERALGRFDPERVDYLEPVYQQGDVRVFRVPLSEHE
jgi:hypothetical protein